MPGFCGKSRLYKAKNFLQKFRKKCLTKVPSGSIMCLVLEVRCTKSTDGSIAQLGEHMPYKHGVTGSSPVVPTTFGPVVQSVSTPACHAGGRRFESVPGRHIASEQSSGSARYASVAQLVEQRTENPRVVGSTPTGGTRCGCSSSGRAPPCQGGGSEFEPRHPLQKDKERISVPYFIRYRSQVVRHESAKL